MTWLVTGSEGTLGRSVVQRLDRLGIPFRSFDRAPAGRPNHIVGDLLDPTSIGSALDGVEVVIHLAALPSDSAGTPEEILRTNVSGTVALVDHAVRSGCRRFVYASSINALGVTGVGHPDRLPLDVDQVAHPASPYQISKRLAEEYLLYVHRASSLEVVILRPPFITDARNYRDWNGSTFDGLPRARSELFAYVDLEDCARAFVLAAEKSSGEPGPYLLSAADTCSPIPTRQLLDGWAIPTRSDLDNYLDGHSHRSLIDVAPTTAALNWQPTTSWRIASTETTNPAQI